MLIDWFTVIAQIVNFLILVWLMKRFLYGPILDAIDAREQRIAAGLADAMAKQREAQRQRDIYREKNEEFERQRNALLAEAEIEVREERQRLLTEARNAEKEQRRRQQEALRADFDSLKSEIMRRVGEEVFAVVRKTLADLASESLEDRMVEAFIRRCRTLGEEERRGLGAAFEAPVEPAVVRSSFELAAERRQDLELAVRDTFAFTGQLRFEESAELVSGIALSVNGYEVAWSIADYLHAFEERVAEVLTPRHPGRERVETVAAEGQSESSPEYGAGGHG